MDERWLPVVGYEGLYEISDAGSVRALERKGLYAGRWRPTHMTFPARMMRICETRAGYKYIALKHPNGKSVKYLLHRLVMRAFVGDPPDEKAQVNHIDGNKANNSVANLEYCTAKENLLHLTKVLKRKVGGSGAWSKLNPDQVMAIRADKRILREIAADYGVTMQAIWYVQKGRNWAHLAPADRQGFEPFEYTERS